MCKFRKLIYTFLFLLSLLLTICLSNYGSNSFAQTQNGLPSIAQQNQTSFAYWRDKILDMDVRCTNKYESFFGQNFTDTLVTGESIVDKLRELKQETGKSAIEHIHYH